MGYVDQNFWHSKKVLLTGHTGFKGGWLSLWLNSMGAEVFGYALKPDTSPNLFDVLQLETLISKSYISDIRDFSALNKVMQDIKPDVVIHMAAQPLVRYSYAHPIDTYATNLMGTVHVLEAVRQSNSVKAAVMVTTDKCYDNKEWVWGYRENDSMGGYDPYSNSKGCAELATTAYRQSFFTDKSGVIQVGLASARAGNVIGGGDWSVDRLIPDAIKSFESNHELLIRNPNATRPWQHVLEPISGYLILAQALFEAPTEFSSGWNFGPGDSDVKTVEQVLEVLIKQWGGGVSWRTEGSEQPHEANLLKLDCSKAKSKLKWGPKWGVETAIGLIVEWQRAFRTGENMREICMMQINQYQKDTLKL
jgi:CDP-glucose 4,6-dehydratase